jgi:predicted nucleic acid-binding Zn ribbon protein
MMEDERARTLWYGLTTLIAVVVVLTGMLWRWI